MKYLKIKKNMYIVEQPVQAPSKAKPVPANTNHIWIYDRSGSMCGELGQLTRDLIDRARTIPSGDTITLGWFSGEGQRNFIVKGFRVTDKADYKVLEEAIRKNNTTVGCTCFSEILEDTDQVLKDLSIFSDSFALCFFTDGYPVVSNYNREISAIKSAIAKIEGRISSSILVGYGNYYNKELMSDMAERLGGSLIHCSALPEFSISLSSFISESSENERKVEVSLAADVKEKDVVFSINGSQINLYSVNEGKVNYIPKKRGGNYVYAVVGNVPTGAKEVVVDDSVVSNSGDKESLVKAAYAAAYLLTQRTKTDMALDVLAVLGDKNLIDAVSSAFTNEEYGKAENRIKNAVLHKNARFLKGRDTNYLPPENAYCLLNALETLMADDDAYFYPYHESFNYNRVSASTKNKEGYPKFNADKSSRCGLNQLTWNESKLNLSLKASINGKIELRDGYEKLGFAKEYPTYVWRNYTLVKDGFLNMRTLPVSLSLSTFDEMQKHGVVDKEEMWTPDGVYVLNLDRIPVINRSIANGRTSAKELCKKVFEETTYKAQLKALNFIKSELDPDSKKLKSDALTNEQVAFLESHGITRNGFAPPQEAVPSTDQYFAKEFDISVKGFSSLPKVDDVRTRVKEGKSLNAAAELIKSGLELFENAPLTKSAKDTKTKVSFVDSLIRDVKRDLNTVRNEIQATKFAIILGKKWFDEFTSREENKLTVDGREFKIGVNEVEVRI